MSSILYPDVPGAAYDDFMRSRAPESRQRKVWQPGDAPLPALYLSHGAPPLFDDPEWIEQLFTWAQKLPRPRAILIVSAHWEESPLSLSATAAATPLVYDFGGFADRYYRMTYPTPDASELAALVARAMPDGVNLHQHKRRGLDHGAWVPLKIMYPDADIPVLQLSMPTHDTRALLALGRSLQTLRSEGVLVIGSGFMTHGLPFMTSDMWLRNKVPAWSAEFDSWAAQALAAGDLDELAAYRNRAPGLGYAHPTVEHFTPLFVTLGAGDGRVSTAIDGYQFGLAKRSFEVA